MENETLRMQFLSGIITEGQYKIKLQENENGEIAAKVEPILNKPEVEKKIEDIYSKLSDDEKKELESALTKLGINASTSPEKAHNAVQNVADDVIGGMSEGDENIDPKKKVADILQGIGGANLKLFGGVPVAALIGSFLVGTVGSPFVVGLGISWGVTTLLMGLAKLLEKEPGLSNESLNESMIGGIVGIGAINQIPSRAKADYETAFEHFLGGKYGLNEETLNEALNKDIEAFGQDLEKKFKENGFDVLSLKNTMEPSEEQLNTLNKQPTAVIFGFEKNDQVQSLMIRVHFSPENLKKAEKIISYFQLVDYDGPTLASKKTWDLKQVQGALNPGDIYKDFSNAFRGGVYKFYRLMKDTGTRVKTIKQNP